MSCLVKKSRLYLNIKFKVCFFSTTNLFFNNKELEENFKKKSIIKFENIRNQVLEEFIKKEENSGIKWSRFPGLNKILKGHRLGELTILSGTTGSGKTTFLSEYTLDLCMQGVPTLWGNFEIKNTKLCQKMLSQLAQKPLENHLDEFDFFADQLTNLPMYFLTFHGEESFENVLKCMNYSVKKFNIQHVVIDNLQFMIGNQSISNNKLLDKFLYQDIIIGKCRNFATMNNCHVTLVVHPRKEQFNEDLNNNSIFGSGKTTQEADNVLILQVKWLDALKFKKFLQITKNRFDGDLGSMPLNFNKSTFGFGQIDKTI